MKRSFVIPHALLSGILFLTATTCPAQAADPHASESAVAKLDEALTAAADGASEARQRLAVRRVIRDAEEMLESLGDSTDRFPVLEFLFRARQQIIALDKDSEHREALLATCRELVKAPDEFAGLRLEADLLLSQAELARQGANAEARAKALRPFVERYVDTPAGAKVLRIGMLMALELGDNALVDDLREMIAERFAADLEMISFQRDKLGGQVFGAPFAGTFKRSDGKTLRFPMDGLGRSTMLVFWSKDDQETVDYIEGIAAAAKEARDLLAGRLEIISINLDDLPDAGESVIRGIGADWQVLHLPGGRENPIYGAYVRSDPRILTVSPTGNTALIMSGSTRQRVNTDGEPDHARMFGSALARSWTEPRYVAHLSSLMAGDFLVFDPEGDLDPALPPELKAAGNGGSNRPLPRTADSVPAEVLSAIQACFTAPPLRYRLPHNEMLANYSRAVDLCRKAIAAHPTAPDLWIVRNRLMVALLGLWKTGGDPTLLDQAVAEAETALAAGFPPGGDVVARFCLARGALRDADVDPLEILDGFVAENGGEDAPGPVFATAAMLALDVADRRRFENYRDVILEKHTESPPMWVFSSFLLDRYHRYWLFQEPFTAGWSYGRREDYFLTKGDAEQASRMLRTELRTIAGKPLRIPEDLDSKWTIILFCQPSPWSKQRDDGLPSSPAGTLRLFTEFANSRPGNDVKVLLATLGGDPQQPWEELNVGNITLDVPVLSLPDGVSNPLVHRLGILSEDSQLNSVLVAEDGRIAAVISGLGRQNGRGGVSLNHVICRADELDVSAALERGETDAAKTLILSLAPPFDPQAVDERGRPLTKPRYSLPHLRARARVYMALGDWESALADAEEVVQSQLSTDGGMSLRTKELDEAEQLRDEIIQLSRSTGAGR